jgi:predicted enzyme related to lactoylglutathione lyase
MERTLLAHVTILKERPMAQTATKINRIDATYYLVKDVERAVKFYTDLLGFAPTMTFGDTGGEWTFSDGATFGLYMSPHVPWHEGNGVMFGTDDLIATVSSCKARGIMIGDEIEDTNVCKMAFGKDTEGNNFILHQCK